MYDFLRELPKAELHVHLEGSVEPETLHELDPATPIEELRNLYTYEDFDGFLRAFGAVGKRLRGPEHYALIARRLIERLAAQNVRYAEIIVSAGVVLWKGQEFGPIFDAIHDAAASAPVEVRWILDAVRQFGPEQAMRVAELAAARPRRGGVRHRRQRNTRSGGVVHGSVRVRAAQRVAAHGSCRRRDGAGAGVGGARAGGGADRPRHFSGRRPGAGSAPARPRDSARSVHHEQSRNGSGAAIEPAPGAAAVRGGRAAAPGA